MEEFTFSFPEYKVLKKHRARLEKLFHVRICLPDFRGQNRSPSVLIFIKIGGNPRNIKNVQKFLKRKMVENTESNHQKGNGIPPFGSLEPQESIPIITIEDEAEDFSAAQTTSRVIRMKKSEVPNTNNHASKSWNITAASFSYTSKNKNMVSSSSSAKQNASSPSCSSSEYGSSNSPENNQNADDSIIILSEVMVSSTSATKPVKKFSRWQKEISSVKHSRKVDKVNKPLPEFIPLRVRNVQLPCECDKKRKLKGNECVEIPALKERRVLRPIVIDGSNVARFHGRPTNTFSSKGIKICVDYFLRRGHTHIKVVLPKSREPSEDLNKPHVSVVTTDEELLKELEKFIVYTPSREVNNKWITCYDDRFIVSLASKTNGVIVSNDYYRDIMMESAEFKQTIDERLLMFCFAWDIIMFPEDPLGVHGPSLSEFLSMRV